MLLSTLWMSSAADAPARTVNPGASEKVRYAYPVGMVSDISCDWVTPSTTAGVVLAGAARLLRSEPYAPLPRTHSVTCVKSVSVVAPTNANDAALAAPA
jgi:hypothetical protein